MSPVHRSVIDAVALEGDAVPPLPGSTYSEFYGRPDINNSDDVAHRSRPDPSANREPRYRYSTKDGKSFGVTACGQ